MPSGMAVSNRGSLAPNLSYRLAIQTPARSGISSDQARTSNCFELTTFTKAEPTNRDPPHASRPRRSKTTKPLPRKILRLRHPGTPILYSSRTLALATPSYRCRSLPAPLSATARCASREVFLTSLQPLSGTTKTLEPRKPGTGSDTRYPENHFDRPPESPFCAGDVDVPFTLRTSKGTLPRHCPTVQPSEPLHLVA